MHFHATTASSTSSPVLPSLPDTLRALLHPWPGIVPELQNRVQRAVIMADGKRVTARDLEFRYPDPLAAADAQRGTGNRRARNGLGRPDASPGQDPRRRPGTWHQPGRR